MPVDEKSKCSEIWTWFKQEGWQTPENETRVQIWLNNENEGAFVKWMKEKGIKPKMARKTWSCLMEHKVISNTFVGNKALALVEADLLDEKEAEEYVSVTKASIRW